MAIEKNSRATEIKKAKEYLDQFKQNRDRYLKDISEWDDSELEDHYRELEKYYGQSIQVDNLLGTFNDPNNEFYWHRLDENNPQKLDRRLAEGWSFVQSEEEVGMKRSQDASRMGSSTVVLDVKGGFKSVLLKIPKKLYQLNTKLKQVSREKKTLFDQDGRPLKITEKMTSSRVSERRIDAGILDGEKLKLN